MYVCMCVDFPEALFVAIAAATSAIAVTSRRRGLTMAAAAREAAVKNIVSLAIEYHRPHTPVAAYTRCKLSRNVPRPRKTSVKIVSHKPVARVDQNASVSVAEISQSQWQYCRARLDDWPTGRATYRGISFLDVYSLIFSCNSFFLL